MQPCLTRFRALFVIAIDLPFSSVIFASFCLFRRFADFVVLSWTTVSDKHSIYVVDVGLTPATCDALVTTTEQACKGRYASYTYAKQTLGCRDYPLLAREALGPIHSVVDAIMAKFEEKKQPELNLPRRSKNQYHLHHHRPNNPKGSCNSTTGSPTLSNTT